ncbi:MAG: SPOR domain-containing protein [Chlorobium sp.]|nr:MAG: SPOR domain-containing protein [Chlorobium sp.]
MFSDKIQLLILKSVAPICVTVSLALFSPPALHAAVERSFSKEIVQYVAEDKVYLLENIRQKVTRPSEKTVVEALLTEDAPKAVSLYQKQLSLYPDPALDQISRARIAAYTLMMESTAASLQPLPSSLQDSTKQQRAAQTTKIAAKAPSTPIITTKTQPPAAELPKQKMAVTPKNYVTIRFGSFQNRENADALAQKISSYAPVETMQQGDFYRVQLKKKYESRTEAEAEGKKIPFAGVVFSVQ